jgi:3-methyl-2-oxobutanoate hydroxymethyltransferase
MRAGAQAVKIEGGVKLAPVVERLVAAGIPVCGHVGLQPQQFYQLGGYRKFGAKNSTEADAVLADALAIEKAGAFAIVGEMLAPELSGVLRNALAIPLIGIGSGGDCDGQILVIHDLLGLTAQPPPFARPRADLAGAAIAAIAGWASEIRATQSAGAHPCPESNPKHPPNL